ncbi:phosphate ABC transporter permease PstA [Helicobacter equorum]|nr:phosphate ABC transporter permease PstA [Helicobacter equorum]
MLLTNEIKDKIFSAICIFFGFLGVSFLLFIIACLIYKGIGGFSLSLFTMPTAFGGLGNAILGQIILVFMASILGLFFGSFAGIYISEYIKNKALKNAFKCLVEVMLSTPSIIVGVFIYATFVRFFGSYSGIAGALALGFIMLCVVAKTYFEALESVSVKLKEASFALGANKMQVIMSVMIANVKPALITGVILGIARIAGESAPLLFTNANNDFFSFDIFSSLPSLSVSIYEFSLSSEENLRNAAWSGAMLLLIMVLGANLISKIAFMKKQ